MCDSAGDRLCDSCASLLPLRPKIIPLAIEDRLLPIPCWTMASYEWPVPRELLYTFKFQGAYALADVLARWWKKIPITWLQGAELAPSAPPFLVPIPMHPKRLKQRGYHQTLLLARHLSMRTGWPVAEHLLTRVAHHSPQSVLAPLERRHAIRGNFVCAPLHAHRGHTTCMPYATSMPDATSRFILIDDVITTGATITECARVLAHAGYTRVTALTLAHAGNDPLDVRGHA